MQPENKKLILQCLDVLILDAKIDLGKVIQDGEKRKARLFYRDKCNDLIEFRDKFEKDV